MNLEEILENKQNITVQEYVKLKEDYDPTLVNFFINDIFKIKILSINQYRKDQCKWKKELYKKYGSKCIITGNNCVAELNACHIVPFCKNNDFDINNGLILNRNIHSTFDSYYWSINPKNNKIICSKKVNNCGTIKNYDGIIIKHAFSEKTIKHISIHYDKFKKIETKR